MPIPVTCTKCGSSLRAPDNAAGKRVKCPKCQGVISVPAAEEEVVDLAQMGVQAEAPAPEPRASRRRREEEYEDEERAPAARRRRELDDYEDDYDDEPRGRGTTQGGGLPMGLGIASLSVGILGMLVALIPCVGALSWPVCGVGLVLGVVGLVIGINKGSAIGFPIAGSAVSGIALIISLVWVFLLARVGQNAQQFAKEFEKAAQEMQKQQLNAMKDIQKQQLDFAKMKPGGLPQFVPPNLGGALNGQPTAVSGAINLAGGKGQVENQLSDTDPNDRLMVGSKCKVFTVTMKAGRTYQIDMVRKMNKGIASLDPFLRLEDSMGKQLTTDDDGGGALNARIVFMCSQDGTFRVVATCLHGTGPFTLKVEER